MATGWHRSHSSGPVAPQTGDDPGRPDAPGGCGASEVAGPPEPVVEIRPIEPADAEALVRFHVGLSMEATRLRYFNPHPRLTPREVEHLTTVDHHTREALVAIHDGELIGVARFERLEPGTDAEVAFVVADRWQGHGIATLLLRRIVDRARAEGVGRLVADTLTENHPMIGVFEHSGMSVTRSFDDGVMHYELGFDEPPAGTIDQRDP